MRFSESQVIRACYMSAASIAALGVYTMGQALSQSSGTQTVLAQSSNLPPVTIDAPQQRHVTRPVIRPRPATSRSAVRRAAPRTPQPMQPVRYVTPSTGTIGAPPAPYAGGQVATGGRVGFLGNRSVMDTPFSQTNFTEQTIKDQQARSIVDVIFNDPSVRPTFGAGGNTERFMIRGFPAQNRDFMFNGYFGLAPFGRVGLEGIERVELFKGPSALLNGITPFGSVGGTINLVPKRAKDAPITDVTFNYLSDTRFGGHADVGRRFGENNEFGVRVNVAGRGGDAPIDFLKEKYFNGTIGLDYRGERFRWEADFGAQQQSFQGQNQTISVNPGFQIPEAPRVRNNLAQKWTESTFTDYYGATRAEFDLTENITLFAGGGAHALDYTAINQYNTLINSAGTLSPFNFAQTGLFAYSTADVGARAKFDTWAIGHTFAVTASGLQQTFNSGGASVPATPPSNIYNPVFSPRPFIDSYGTRPKISDTLLKSIAVADTMSVFGDRILFTAGARYQNVEATNFNGTTGAVTQVYDQSRVSPAFGIVVKPLQNISLYANYIEGLQQGAVAPATAVNAGQAFAPFVSAQQEAGVKIDFGKVTVTTSVFEISQPSTVTTAGVFSVSGEQRNRGVEVNTFGEVAPGFRILGGAAYIDGRLTKTQGGVNDGRYAVGVPTTTVNLGGEYDIPYSAVTLTGRVIYTSRQFVDQGNTQVIPDWTRLDLGARYTTSINGTPVIFRANVLNVFDKNYWESAQAGLAVGGARTFLLSSTFKF